MTLNDRLSRLIVGIDPNLVPDLLAEVGEKNTVQVSVFRGVRGETGLRHRRSLNERFAVTPQSPSLLRQDLFRAVAGLKPVFLAEAVRRMGGELAAVVPNLRTNLSYDFAAQQLSGSSALVADTIALSANAGGASASHGATTSPWSSAQTTNGTTGEFTTYGGLARAAATYAHTVTGPTSATTTYTLSKTFTASNTVTGVQLAGLFGGSSKATQGGTDTANTLVLETAFTAQNLVNTDQLAITWTVTV